MFSPMRPILMRPIASPVRSVVRYARAAAATCRSREASLPRPRGGRHLPLEGGEAAVTAELRLEGLSTAVVRAREPRLLDVRVDGGEGVLPAPDADHPGKGEHSRCDQQRSEEPAEPPHLSPERAPALCGYAPPCPRRQDDRADE